jgi:hypothetical protein
MTMSKGGDTDIQPVFGATPVIFGVLTGPPKNQSQHIVTQVMILSTSCFGGSSPESVPAYGSTLRGATGSLSGAGIR